MFSDRQLFRQFLAIPTLKPLGLNIVSAQGIYLTDREGNQYIDLVSGVTVSNLGHHHPAIIQAIKDQADKYLHLMVYGEYIQSPQVRLAKALADKLPSQLNNVFFVNSGSEAIEGALKLAKRHTGRTEIVAFRNAYHGSTHGALSILGNEYFKNSFRPLLPGIRLMEFNSFEDLAMITDKTACIIAETIQAEAGVILPDEGFLDAVAERCRKTGALLVIDDVQMGFGRTGKLFSIEHYGITPDILVLAKALGGGMPLGAFISSKEIMQSLMTDPVLGHITTFGGHPVCCAAGLASFDLLCNSGIITEVGDKGDLFFDRLSSHPQVKEIRYKGLMLAVELNSAKQTEELGRILLENGIVIDIFLFRPEAFRISPPLIITNDEIEKSCHIILKCLDLLG
jgi:acetylornithine/N-succinyldiaminopimelate aminotransferase